MEITDVRAVPLSDQVPEAEQHRTDLGTKVKTDSTLVYVETDAGVTGIGAALGHPPTIRTIVEDSLAPALIGEDPTYTGRLWETMYNGSRAEPSIERGYSQPRGDRRGVTMEAISGLDIALWDLHGKAVGEPVYKLLGAVRDEIRAYASGGWKTGTEVGEQLAGYAEQGFDAVKMRAVGQEEYSVGNVIERVAAAREAIGDDVDLMVDAHGSLDVPSAIKLARRMEQYDVAWFEEPVSPDDHPGLAEVRAATEIPIAAGESEFTRFDVRSLLDRDAIDVVQPDVARAGGITECRRIAAMASARNVKFAPHAWGSGVLFAASVHLAMATANCHVLEVSQGYMPVLFDLFEEEFDVSDGRVRAPDRPGFGFTLRDDVEERFEYVEGPEYVF
ncbi:MAG: mandelate racemase/muconate lactonizing enzyme family protein [Haloarculaceae archaeon]